MTAPSTATVRRNAIAVASLTAAVTGLLLTAGATPAGAATSACTGWASSSTPPSTIRVLIYAAHDPSGYGSKPAHVDTVPFQTYVDNVLPNEWPASWRPAALQAGAVAAKEYGWYYAMHTGHGGIFNGACYDVTDDTRSQRYVPDSARSTTTSAVTATWNAQLLSGGAVFATSYRANLTGSNGEACGAGVSSRPNTMSQYGSQACAVAGLNFDGILARYYPDAQLVQQSSRTAQTMVAAPHGGYYLLSADGKVHPFGGAPNYGDAAGQGYFAGQSAVALGIGPSGAGYWIVSAAGGVYSYGNAAFHGSAAGQSYFNGQTAVGIAPTPDGGGYWLLSANGGIYSYGNAAFHGSAAGQSYFNGQTAVGIAPTPDGGGYWLLSANGGIYSYGNAAFHGSAAGQSYFNGQTAVGIAPTPDGGGYWLLSANGGIYSYGNAAFHGSAAGQSYFNGQTAVGIAPTPDGGGYWLASRSGGVYSFGDAQFAGSGL